MKYLIFKLKILWYGIRVIFSLKKELKPKLLLSCFVKLTLESFIYKFRQYNMWYYLFEPRHDKTNKMSVRPAKTQISLGIRPVWSESSLCAQWVAKDPRFLHAYIEDSDQTGRMPRLIWVIAGRTLTLLVLSCRGSFNILLDQCT